MSRHKINAGDDIVNYQHVTLLELLDRLLDKGVVVKGEVLLSVADVDLVYLNLGLLLSSVKTAQEAARSDGNGYAKLISWQSSPQGEFLDAAQLEVGREDVGTRFIASAPLTREHS